MKEKQQIYMPVRFTTMLNRVLLNRITYITAPSGYGKTTLLNHWSQLSKLPFLWLEISDPFNDPKALVTHLDQVSNQSRNHGHIIIMDHIHRLTEPEAIAALKKWIVQTHTDHTFILLSRHEIPGIKHDADLHHQTFHIDTNDLKFSYEETDIWISQQSATEWTEDQLVDLYDITEGCPMFLQLAFQHYQRCDGPLLDNRGRVAPLIEDYVRNQWLGQLAGDIRQHIPPLGVPPYFSYDFASELIDADIESLFRELETCLLITKKLVNNRWLYRFHPLVRATIKERTTVSVYPKELTETTPLFLEKEGLHKEAIEVAIQGGITDLALQYMKRLAPEILMSQDFKTLNNWLEQLTPEQFSQDKEITSLHEWVGSLMDSSKNPIGMMDKVEDIWSPYIPLNQGSIPFIHSHFGYAGDINKVIDHDQVSPSSNGDPAFPAFRQLALAEAYYEQNNLHAARRNLEHVWRLAKDTNNALPGLSIPALWVDLLCHQSEGREIKVNYIVEEIYYRSLQTTIPVWRRIGEAAKTYVLLQEGYLDEAEEWLSRQNELLHLNWNKWTSFEYFMFARALLTFREVEEVSYLLSRMVTAATYEMNPGNELKRRILQTIAAIKLEQHEEAKAFLKEALELGHDYGYIRSFLDEDPIVFSIFPDVESELPDHLQRYSHELVQLVNKEELKEIKDNPKMKEALTLREIEIIKYIQKGLSNRAIGKQMHITEGTVKGHLNRIFKKLNVRNRVQAVKTAEKQLLV